MKTTIILIFIILLSNFPLKSQDYAPIEDPQLLTEYKQAVITSYPGIQDKIKVQKAEKINDKHSLIYYTDGFANYQCVLNSARNEMFLVVQFKEIKKADIPQIVIDQLKDEQYSNWKFQKGFEAQRPSSELFYALEIKKGKSSKKVFFDKMGRSMQKPY